MKQYVKLIDNQLYYPPKNKENIINYNLNIDLLIQDGYKELIEAEKPQTNRLHHIEYIERVNTIEETIIYDETQSEADEREIREEKERKTLEIDNKIQELEQMSINEILYNNSENIKIYQDIINGLEETRSNL